MQNASTPNEALVIREMSRMNQGENEKSTELVTVSRFDARKTVSPGFWKCLQVLGCTVLCKERMLETNQTVGNI